MACRGYARRRIVVLGHTLNTSQHVITKKSHKYIYDFVLGRTHSHPGPCVVHGPRMGHPRWKTAASHQERACTVEPPERQRHGRARRPEHGTTTADGKGRILSEQAPPSRESSLHIPAALIHKSRRSLQVIATHRGHLLPATLGQSPTAVSAGQQVTGHWLGEKSGCKPRVPHGLTSTHWEPEAPTLQAEAAALGTELRS